VCRAIIRDPHLAEDAAQAVFLVLARKAGTLAGVRSVSGWVARVAYRAAQRVRVRTAVCATAPLAEAQAHVAPDPDPADFAAASDQAAVVWEEVHRLPERYHAPVVLCYFDGLTHTEAATRLGWPAGTVAGRLARARAVLRNRLTRRGVAIPAAGLTLLLAKSDAVAVPGRFAGDVLRAVRGADPNPVVSELTQEVLKAMTPSIRHVLVYAAVVVGLVVAAAVAFPLSADEQPQPEKPPEKKQEKKPVDKPADPRLAFDEKLANEGKFVVVGRVISIDNEPLEDVKVYASAGYGTLSPTGETKTDKDGQFRLVFEAGIHYKTGPGGIAIIGVQKPGWHGWAKETPGQNETRGRFELSAKPLPKENIPKGYTNLVAGKPFELTFSMQPAATLRAKLVDGAGKPMANTRIWLTGENLPPGASVIKDGRTDKDGIFTVADVPRHPYRLIVVDDEADGRGRGTLELGQIHFHYAAEYDVEATIHEWSQRATHTSFKVTRGRDR